MGKRIRECLERCRECQTSGIETVDHNLRTGGKFADPNTFNLILACADICATTSRFVRLRSEFYLQMCEACADVCDACADACESKGPDPAIERWIDACRRCAEACRMVAGALGARARHDASPEEAIRTAGRWTFPIPNRFARA